MAPDAPRISGRGPGLLTPRRLACSAAGNLAETFELMVRQSCHRCQEDRLLFFSNRDRCLWTATIVMKLHLDIGDMARHPRRNPLRHGYDGVAGPGTGLGGYADWRRYRGR